MMWPRAFGTDESAVHLLCYSPPPSRQDHDMFRFMMLFGGAGRVNIDKEFSGQHCIRFR